MVETNKHAVAHLLLTYFTDQGEEARSRTSVQLAHTGRARLIRTRLIRSST